MRRILLSLLSALLLSGVARAQIPVTDAANITQSIVNSVTELVQTSTTAENMIGNFKETMKIYRQGKEYYDRLRNVTHLVRDARKVQQSILLVGELSDIYVTSYDKMLTDDNYLVLKFFLHLSPEQQKKNIAKNAKTLGKAWRDLNPAIDESEDYDKFLPHYEKMLEATDTVNAPWHLIADDDPRSARLEVFTKIADAIEKAVQMPVEPAADKRTAATYDVLSTIDANKELTKEEYKEKLDKYQKKLTQLQIEMFKAQIPVVIGFEGWDAAGKGGAIRRLTAALDPLGFHVHPIAAPNVVEKQFHYQWRFWTRLPQPGTIAIFDRTWYGRVMVERIEGFAKPQEWQRAYDEIKDMEAQWSEHGIAIAKFWLQIDKDEQLRRFNDRQNDPNKQWKITDEDWRNRDKWDAYEAAVNEMLVRTDTSYAPWTVVEGNNKYYARLKVLKTVIDLFERKLAEKHQ